MKNNNEKMNIIYFKRTGEIYTALVGNEGLTIFGEHEEDFKLMLDSISFEKNDEVLWNTRNYKINLVTKQLEYIEKKWFNVKK